MISNEGIIFDSLTSDPTTPENGRTWFNSSEGAFKIRIGGVTKVATLGGVVGENFQYAESEAIDADTATSYQQKLRLTTPTLPAGDYRIGYQFELKTSNAAKSVWGRVQVDDTTNLLELESSHDMLTPHGGFKKVTLGAGIHTVDVDYRATAGATVSIQSARLEFWRVG